MVGFCIEIHRELGKGHDEVIYKDALVVEMTRALIPFAREKNYEFCRIDVVTRIARIDSHTIPVFNS